MTASQFPNSEQFLRRFLSLERKVASGGLAPAADASMTHLGVTYVVTTSEADIGLQTTVDSPGIYVAVGQFRAEILIGGGFVVGDIDLVSGGGSVSTIVNKGAILQGAVSHIATISAYALVTVPTGTEGGTIVKLTGFGSAAGSGRFVSGAAAGTSLLIAKLGSP